MDRHSVSDKRLNDLLNYYYYYYHNYSPLISIFLHLPPFLPSYSHRLVIFAQFFFIQKKKKLKMLFPHVDAAPRSTLHREMPVAARVS